MPRSSANITVCRGGRCGGRKHPLMDHEGQLDTFRAAAAANGGISLTVTDCLALCSASNVIVVRHGRERQFFGRAASDEATAAFTSWIDAGLEPTAPESVEPWRIDTAREFEQGD